MTTAAKPKDERSTTLLLVIGVFKLIKAALLILIGIGALHLIGEDVWSKLREWARQANIDPDNKLFDAVLSKVPAFTPDQLRELSAGTFFYAALFLAEGTGLLLRKHWAEYLTIVVTALFLPLEIYEIAEKVTAVRVGALVLNLAILVYLIVRVRATRREARAAAA